MPPKRDISTQPSGIQRHVSPDHFKRAGQGAAQISRGSIDILDESLILSYPVVQLTPHGIGFVRQPIRKIRSRGLRRFGDRFDEPAAAAGAADFWIDVKILKVASGDSRPSILVK